MRKTKAILFHFCWCKKSSAKKSKQIFKLNQPNACKTDLFPLCFAWQRKFIKRNRRTLSSSESDKADHYLFRKNKGYYRYYSICFLNLNFFHFSCYHCPHIHVLYSTYTVWMPPNLRQGLVKKDFPSDF